MSESFFCGTCQNNRPMQGSSLVKVKRGLGVARVRRCADCLERTRLAAEKRFKDKKEVSDGEV